MTTTRRRRHLIAGGGDTIRVIAARELPGQADAGELLLSWNLHLTLRRDPVGLDGPLLATDIVYLEAPLA